MQHLEGSGTPVLYIGRTFRKGYVHSLFALTWRFCINEITPQVIVKYLCFC
jgi:hypothetical protein